MSRSLPPSFVLLLAAAAALAQPPRPDWSSLESETMEHFQALLRFDTSDPPGRERPAADYLRRALEDEGIPVQMLARDPDRPNVVARLAGAGDEPPLLIMAHTDTVNVDLVQTVEKIPYAVEVVARGVAGHGSVPLRTNSVARLSRAVARIADWRTPIRLNETTSTYFERLAMISTPDDAARYRSVLDPELAKDADEYFLEHEPRHASMLRSSLSPTIFEGGYRINVIPSDARATVDFRALPDEDVPAFLDRMRELVDDPAIEIRLGERDTRPPGEARLDTEAFRAIEARIREHYDAVTLPTMSTGATDMAYLRDKGIQCYGIGPALDFEDGPKGFGAHSDQERILETELHRFVRFKWDVVIDLAAQK